MTTRASNIANRLRQIRDRSPQDLRPRHRRLPGQQHLHGQVPRLFQVPSFEIQDLRHPQIGATHDERRGARLVSIVGRQGVQQALDLVSSPVVRNGHRGRLHQTKSARMDQRHRLSPERRPMPEGQKWQSCTQTLPTTDHQPSPSNLPTTPSSITGCPGASQTRHLPGRPFRPASSCRPRPNNPRPDPGQQEL